MVMQAVSSPSPIHNPIVLERRSLSVKVNRKSQILHVIAAILSILSCAIFIAMIVLFPYVALWAGILGIAVGLILFGLAILVTLYATTCLKVLEGKSPKWTIERDVLGNKVRSEELTQLFARGVFPKELAVYCKKGGLDFPASLKNVLKKLEPITTCLHLLNQKLIYTNILLYLVQQWNKADVYLKESCPQELAQLLLKRLMELSCPSPDLLLLLNRAGVFSDSSFLLDFATRGKFCVKNNGTFCFEFTDQPVPVEEALGEFERLLSLRTPDIFFGKDAFFTYVMSSKFFETFLCRHLESLIKRDPYRSLVIDPHIRIEQMKFFMARYTLRMQEMLMPFLEWRIRFNSNTLWWKSANKMYEKIVLAFAVSFPAMRRMLSSQAPHLLPNLEIHHSIYRHYKLLANSKSLNSKYMNVMRVIFGKMDMSIFTDWVIILETIKHKGLHLDIEADYNCCLQALDQLLSYASGGIIVQKFPSSIKPRQEQRDTSSDWIMRVLDLAKQGFSFTALKALIRLLGIEQSLWEDALPLFHSLNIYEQLKDFIQGN
ncbi:hypothetical protein [Candidatus Chlamydia sanziniae]|uniref:Uncharacterized protein n=1 Tax=Candidatus Chlamydia sanziniae TaxID=1806891 RepID=A0A1A9HVY0_9CHLA|nr:hypothetical protein [Candidatus Chlamydia sanziniae]ANH78272.1 hypothetical protein Cs308_0101 [Candidatus Chlamydia sanziniae]